MCEYWWKSVSRIGRCAFLVSLSLFFGLSSSFAQSLSVEGSVLKLEKKSRFIANLGRTNGAYAGMKVQLYRRVVLLHPITKKKFKDRFHIGQGFVKQVSRFLAIVEVKGTLSYPLALGDFVVPGDKSLRPSRSNGLPGKVLTRTKVIIKRVPVPCKRCVPGDKDAAAVQKVWFAMRGKTLRQRLNRWRNFILHGRRNKHLGHILSYVKWLGELEKRQMEPEPKEALEFLHRPPEVVYNGDPLELTAAIVSTWPVAAVICHYRKQGEALYRTVHMKSTQKYYYRTEIPLDLRRESGGFEYFIELIDKNGNRHQGYAKSSDPVRVTKRKRVIPKVVKKGRSFASTYLEYVDYFTKAFGSDSYLKLEADYRYLLFLPYLRSVKMGFGIFEGQGADVAALDRDPNTPPEPRAYSYGYLEGEFHFHVFFSTMTRIILGSARKRVSVLDPGTIFGAELRFRIGRINGTNLQLAGSLTRHVGGEAELTVTIMEIPRFPMAASVLVSNLPLGGGDLGVRLVYTIGWRPIDWFSLDGRFGWNIRNINHSGPTFGLGLTFRW